MKQFQISPRYTKIKRIVKVYVYDDVESMQSAARRHDKKAGHEIGEQNYLGICHKFERIAVYEDGAEKSDPFVSIIRLVKEHCKTGIISHECTHAALWIYQLEHEDLNELKDEIEREEDLCHIQSDLMYGLVKKLYQYKII